MREVLVVSGEGEPIVQVSKAEGPLVQVGPKAGRDREEGEQLRGAQRPASG